jgi:NADH dehydrogenase
MPSLRILVLGGTGFVGTALASRLAAAGHTLTLPTRSPSRAKHLSVLPRTRLVGADVHDAGTLEHLCRGVDVVVNLVGILNEAGHSGAGFRHAHTELAAKVIGACQRTGVRRLLQMSSLRAAEDAPSHYLRSKGAAERLIRDAGGELEWTIFRPSVIFGAGDSLTNRFAGLVRWLPVLPIARAEARFAPVWVDDVVDAMVSSLERSDAAGATYELGGPEVISLGNLVRYVAMVVGTRCRVLALPDVIGFLQAWIFEYLPGKILSLDNYRSLSLPSVPDDDGFARLGLSPSSMRSIVPGYLS